MWQLTLIPKGWPADYREVGSGFISFDEGPNKVVFFKTSYSDGSGPMIYNEAGERVSETFLKTVPPVQSLDVVWEEV